MSVRDFIHVNLLPIEYRVVKKDYSFLVDWRLLLGTLLLVLAVLSFVAGRQFIEVNLATKRVALVQVEAEIGRNAFVAEKIRELEKVRDEKNAKNNSLKSISVNKRKWVRILEGLSKSMPLNTWLELLKQNEGDAQDMEVLGRTYVFPEVAEYMMELEKNEYFQQVSLASIEFQKEAAKDEERSYFLFTLKIRINPAAGMETFAHETAPGKVL